MTKIQKYLNILIYDLEFVSEFRASNFEFIIDFLIVPWILSLPFKKNLGN